LIERVKNFDFRVNGSEKISVALILRRYGSDCSLSQMSLFDDDSSWPISLSGTCFIQNLFLNMKFVAFSTKKVSETSLTLLDTKKENVAEANLEPMKIKVFHFDE
jgi:alpha-mannosidase II